MTKEEKYHLYATARVAGKSKREAAIAAGYSEKTASAAGTRLEKDPDIQALLTQYRASPAPTAAEPTTAPTPTSPVKPPRDRAIRKSSDIVELDGTEYNLTDPKDMLTLSMLGVISPTKAQLDSAKALMPFLHGKVAEQGKKESELERAREAGQNSRFQSLNAPRLPEQITLIN